MSEKSTLLIIGNGFDLHCRLKSSYGDFFEWAQQNNDNITQNLWLTHFRNVKLKTGKWASVEECIGDVLNRKNDFGILMSLKNLKNYFHLI